MCRGIGVVHHFSNTTRGRTVFAVSLPVHHPDNALKDRYLSRNEPGTRSHVNSNEKSSRNFPNTFREFLRLKNKIIRDICNTFSVPKNETGASDVWKKGRTNRKPRGHRGRANIRDGGFKKNVSQPGIPSSRFSRSEYAY